MKHASKRNHPSSILRKIAIAFSLTIAVSFSGIGITFGYLSSQVNVSRASDYFITPIFEEDENDDSFEEVEIDRSQAQNILIIGLDYGLYDGGLNTDTIMLLHIPQDEGRITLGNFPRDTLVTIPSCLTGDGNITTERTQTMINSAFVIGAGNAENLHAGTACLIQTIELATGASITDHMILKVDAVEEIIDMLGGIEVDLPEAVEGNHNVELSLPAGVQRLNGDQSINFIRARGGSGMNLEQGGDLARIDRQHFFMQSALSSVSLRDLTIPTIATMINSVTVSENLANPLRAFALLQLVFSSANDSMQFSFVELPTKPFPENRNRLIFDEQVEEIFANWR